MIEGKIVNLRALEKEDLELLKKWRNDKKTQNTYQNGLPDINR